MQFRVEPAELILSDSERDDKEAVRGALADRRFGFVCRWAARGLALIRIVAVWLAAEPSTCDHGFWLAPMRAVTAFGSASTQHTYFSPRPAPCRPTSHAC
jgi:hypothetical protein